MFDNLTLTGVLVAALAAVSVAMLSREYSGCLLAGLISKHRDK